jgi:hypothetical protein
MKCNLNNRYADELSDKDKIKFYDRCKYLRNYANTFFNQLQQEYSLVVNVKVLPLVFFEGAKLGEPERGGENFISKSKLPSLDQVQINIYNVLTKDMDILEMNIRHEIIHYALLISGLKHEDDTAIFYVMCEKYNACHYAELSPEEKELLSKYNAIIDTFKEFKESKPYVLGLGENENGKYRKEIEKAYKLVINHSNEIS